jgi:hypothetical protein
LVSVAGAASGGSPYDGLRPDAMDTKLLIDAIVQQTTVLIAQLSTAAGVRAPLSHIADQVFVELAREIEAQGVRRKVVADMFGLALRSYQLKVQRLLDNERPAPSIWQDVYAELSAGARTKQELSSALRPADPKDVASVLRDLVGSGLSYSSGRGASTVYGLTSDADRQRFSLADEQQALVNMVWQLVATERATSREELLGQLNVSALALERALLTLMQDGRADDVDGKLTAAELSIPVGAEQGWEAAVSDHFRSVATAIASKLRLGRSAPGDVIGGGTLSFTVHDGHPMQQEVYGLLERVRRELGEVQERVAELNRATPPPDEAVRVTFYFGQTLTGLDGLERDRDDKE